ncbi:MAG: hypothetical protein ICV51_20165 [Flavisolibacter sp.]|nr:hypothetical protein [Flavisolibacter sp.]
MKHARLILFFIMTASLVWGQDQLDSVQAIVNRHAGDTTEVNALIILGSQQDQPDSIAKYARQAFKLSKELKYGKGEADSYHLFARVSANQGNFGQAIQKLLHALELYEEQKDKLGMATARLALQALYREIGDLGNALLHGLAGERIAESNNLKAVLVFNNHHLAPLFLAEIAQTYVLKNQWDSALFYTQQSIKQKELFNGSEWGFPVYLLATIQTMQRNYNQALENYRRSIALSFQNGFARDTLQIYSGLSTLFRKTGQLDSAVYYAQIVVRSWSLQSSEMKNYVEALQNLAAVYKTRGEKDSALKYVELSHVFQDSIFSREKDREVQNITFNETLKRQQMMAAQLQYKSKVQLYTLLSGLLVLLLIAAILWRNNRHKQQAKQKIEKAYNELKATQAQLVQREKMASLGELTAGIAHEIQNPLNFVNNFSEVNTELLDELEQQITKGNLEEVKSIAGEVKRNEQKISQHGSRADAIVKNMLQHSRISTGEKQPTNINVLAEEYLRLSYHGMRAKDKSFHAVLQTSFDNSIGQVNVAPQDMGRVFVNLFNNAFYATNEKKKQLNGVYEPTVSVTTKWNHGKVEIIVHDNGTGISPRYLDKIFQPFFTTKPTGEGTGLGLSLSYDIVTKGHGGELSVSTREGEGAEFIIRLPINQSV